MDFGPWKERRAWEDTREGDRRIPLLYSNKVKKNDVPWIFWVVVAFLLFCGLRSL